MLSVNINQDVEQYQEAVAFGLNGRQTLAALLALAVGVGITCLLYFYVGFPMEMSIYISLPVCVPIMIPVLGKQYGLTVTERFKQNNKRKKVLVYAAGGVSLKAAAKKEPIRVDSHRKGEHKSWNEKAKENRKKRQIHSDKE